MKKIEQLEKNSGHIRIGIIREFHAAHWLNDYKGKCANIHGHAWKVECIISSEKLNKLGMVIDFGVVKKQLDTILSKLDHQIVNFVVNQPTAENISRYIYNEMYKWIRYQTVYKSGIKYYLEEIKVFETEVNFCSYTYDNWFSDKKEELAKKSSDRMKDIHNNPLKQKALIDKMKRTFKDNPDIAKNSSKRMIENNPMSKRENVERMLVSLRKTLKMRPNKVESCFISLCERNNLPYSFVGDLSFLIDGKNPDFIHKRKKRIIEIFGKFWHTKNKWYNTSDDKKERVQFFKSRGWDCLIIWDDELLNEEKVLLKIKKWECELK